MNKNLGYFLEFLFLAGLFLVVSYIVQSNSIWFENNIGNGPAGIVLFFAFLITSVVVTPISAIPLIPLATSLWGWVDTWFLLFVGWTLGGFCNFIIAKKWGVPIVKRIVSMEKVNEVERHIPKKNLFWGLVLLRAIGQVGIVGYATGLFLHIGKRKYILATFLGILIFSLPIAYLGTFPYKELVTYVGVSTFILLLIFIFVIRKRNLFSGVKEFVNDTSQK